MAFQQFNNHKLTIIGLALLIPAVLLEAAGMSKFYWSPDNPVYQAFESVFSDPRNGALNILAQGVVVFGPPIAVLLCALPILRINIRKEADTLVSTIAIKGNVLNLVIVAIGLAAMAVITVYIIGENAPCILGYKLSC